jgi:hypothetical protein
LTLSFFILKLNIDRPVSYYIEEIKMKKRLRIASLLLSSLMISTSNQTFAITPEQLLADGQDQINQNGRTVRKGSIKALIDNVAELNLQLTEQGDPAKAHKAIADLFESMETQKELKVFEMFPPTEWIQSKDQPGKVMAGVLYLQHYPAELSSLLKSQLINISKSAHSLLKAEIQKLLYRGESK